MRRGFLPALGSCLLLATTAAAQHGGSSVPAGKARTPDSPNLKIPNSLGMDVRRELEAAIAQWKRAERAIQRLGAEKARPQVDKAIEMLDAVRAKDGDCALPEYYLGIGYQLLGLYYGEKTYVRAITRLKTAVKLKPGFHEALVELGDAYGHMKKSSYVKRAEKEYGKAIAVSPDYMPAYMRRATVRFKQERFAEARGDIETALRLRPHDPSLKMLKRKLDMAIDGPSWPVKYVKETKSYQIYTNVSQAFADEIAKQAEQIRRLYLSLFPKPPKTKRKYPIIVFKDKREYHQNGGPKGAGGHYDPMFKQLFLFRYPKKSDTLLVLYHEGYHQYLDGILKTKAPQWFNEGVADFFGPSVYVNKNGKEGMEIKPNPWRLRLIKMLIRQNKWTKFKRLMNMTQREMYGKDVGNHYAQAWSMIHFFLRAERGDKPFGKYAKYMKDYFLALMKGKSRAKAYKAAFKKADMEALEEAWKKHVLRIK